MWVRLYGCQISGSFLTLRVLVSTDDLKNRLVWLSLLSSISEESDFFTEFYIIRLKCIKFQSNIRWYKSGVCVCHPYTSFLFLHMQHVTGLKTDSIWMWPLDWFEVSVCCCVVVLCELPLGKFNAGYGKSFVIFFNFPWIYIYLKQTKSVNILQNTYLKYLVSDRYQRRNALTQCEVTTEHWVLGRFPYVTNNCFVPRSASRVPFSLNPLAKMEGRFLIISTQLRSHHLAVSLLLMQMAKPWALPNNRTQCWQLTVALRVFSICKAWSYLALITDWSLKNLIRPQK